MKIHRMQQGSAEWLAVRAGIPTASEFDNLVTPLGKVRTGETPRTYRYRKLAERWFNRPIASPWIGKQAEQGQIFEPEARSAFEFQTGIKVEQVGFITADKFRAGCSPDGLLVDQPGGIEIKCPEAPQHLRYLLDGKLPDDYVCQVQGSMLVTDADEWRFISYCRGFPMFLITVQRDHELTSTLLDAISKFNAELDKDYAILLDINGGPPEPPHEVEVRSMPGVTQADWDAFISGPAERLVTL